MAIYRQNRETIEMHRYGKNTIEIWSFFNNAWTVAWQAIRSCFGAGVWRGDKPWVGSDSWKG